MFSACVGYSERLYGYLMSDEAAGTLLRNWRAKTKRTQEALAAACGCSQVFIAQLESGKRTPSRRIAMKLHDMSGGEVPFPAWPDAPGEEGAA